MLALMPNFLFPLERVIFPDYIAAILYTPACMWTEIFNTTGAPLKKRP